MWESDGDASDILQHEEATTEFQVLKLIQTYSDPSLPIRFDCLRTGNS